MITDSPTSTQKKTKPCQSSQRCNIIPGMRLFQKREIWYVEFPGRKRRSLKTKDAREAKGIFRDLKREYLRGNLLQLEKQTGRTISDLKKLYISSPDRADLSDKSLTADELAIRSLMDVAGDIPVDHVTANTISKFKQSCSARGMKPVSVNTHLRRIRAALNFAVDNDLRTEPVPRIKLMKTGSALPRIIESGDIERILSAAMDRKPEMYRIIQFALFTGTRRKEIITARYEHIHDGSIVINGKGAKERLIPLIDHVFDIIGHQDIGKIFSYAHTSTVSNYYREITRAAGVQSRFHDLRHTAATRMLTVGIPLEVVQKILGHTEIRTTQIYSQVVQERLKIEMEKLKY